MTLAGEYGSAADAALGEEQPAVFGRQDQAAGDVAGVLAGAAEQGQQPRTRRRGNGLPG